MSKAPIEPDFETLFAAAPGLYMVLDPNLRIVAATEAYLRATLTRRADILGRYVFDVFPDNPGDPSADAVRNSTASFRRVLQSHVTDVMGLQRHDVRKPEAEGGGWEARYWNAINSPVLKPDGSLAYIMHHVDNVTELVLLQEQGVKQASVTEALRAQAAQMKAEIAERQRAEAALRESEKRFRSVVENMSEGLMLFDAQGNFTYQNPASLRTHGSGTPAAGYVENENLSATWKVWDDTGRPMSFEEWPVSRVLRGERFQDQILRAMRVETGQEFYASYNGCPIIDANGRLTFGFITIREITEQRKAEVAVRESEERFRTLAENNPHMIARYDRQHRILYINQAAQTVTGQPPGSFIGKSARELGMPVEIRARWEESQDRAFGGERVTIHTELKDPAGRERRILDSFVPEYAPDGSITTVLAISQDVTELGEMQSALRESEERLRLALTATELGTWDYDPVTGALVCDARSKELFGLPPEIDVNYDMFLAGLHPDDRERENQVVQRTFDPASDGLFDVEYRTVGLRDGGMVRWVHATGRASFNAASQAIRFIGTVQDITGRKRAEEALRLTQASVDGAAEMVAWFTPDSRVHYANDATCRALGYSREELVQMSALDFSPGFTWEQYHQHWEEVRKRKSFTLEVTHRRKDGTEYQAEVLVNHVVYGGHEYLFAYGRDITERKRVEEALWRSEKLYRAIGESIDYGIWVCAPDGRNTYASESYLKLVGMTQEQCSNFGWGDVLHPEDAERTIAAWKECVRTEGRWDSEHRFRGVDGKWHPILARGGPVRDEQGQITCWAGINLDISALKQTEESLRESESRERARAVEMEALMDAAPAAIFIARDPECLSMSGNRAAYALLRR